MQNIEQCTVCDTTIPSTGTSCKVCQEPIGFPNVRLAVKEESALECRYQMEMESVKTRGIEDVALDFENVVSDANVIIARSVVDLMGLIGNENKLISTYHQQVASGARLAENNYYDPMRDSVESVVNPLYYKDINYAALSLDSIGVKHYGEAHIKLHNKFIQNRTSFFQENPFNMVTKLKLSAGDVFPEGYRSTWHEKGKLALCKCHASLERDNKSIDDFQKILLVESENADFIEAHIYGSIHVKCIEGVTLLDDASKTSKMLFDAYQHTFVEKGIRAEVREL
jgi:hypothetical protein